MTGGLPSLGVKVTQPIAGTGVLLKGWALEIARDHFTRTEALLPLEERTDLAELYVAGVYDEGVYVSWNVQDGAGGGVVVIADYTSGLVAVSS